MKSNKNKGNHNNKNIVSILKSFNYIILLLIIIFIVYGLYNVFINVNKINNNSNINNKVYEGFNNIIMGDYYGNIVYNNENMLDNTKHIELKVNNNKPYVDLTLPGEYKLTGFNIKLYDNIGLEKDEVQKYKFSILIGNDTNNMKEVINNFSYSKFDFGSTSDVKLFENDDGTPKYSGNKIRIKLENIENMSPEEKNIDYYLNCKIYALDVYSPSYKEYSNYTSYNNITSSDSDIVYSSNNDDNNKLTLNSGNKKIVAITFNNYINNNLKIKYSNDYDGNKRKYVVKGPIQEGYDVSNTNIIYFTKPIIANNLYFNNDVDINNIYFSEVSKRDEINFKIKTDTGDELKGLVVEGEKCPNINQMLQKQLQAQQICEALEYKDRIKNSKIIYEKEKTYLEKLSKQEQELKELEQILNRLLKRKNDRVNKNQYYNVEQLDKELKEIENARKQAEEDIIKTRNAHDIKVELNLDPQYTDVLKKFEGQGLF
jgi:hypothetical protein